MIHILILLVSGTSDEPLEFEDFMSQIRSEFHDFLSQADENVGALSRLYGAQQYPEQFPGEDSEILTGLYGYLNQCPEEDSNILSRLYESQDDEEASHKSATAPTPNEMP